MPGASTKAQMQTLASHLLAIGKQNGNGSHPWPAGGSICLTDDEIDLLMAWQKGKPLFVLDDTNGGLYLLNPIDYNSQRQNMPLELRSALNNQSSKGEVVIVCTEGRTSVGDRDTCFACASSKGEDGCTYLCCFS